MASWHATAAASAPARAPARKRPRARDLDHKGVRSAPKRRAKAKGGVAGGLAWIIVAGVLLTGIVALNVAVLRLNIRLDHMNNQSQQLQAENAALGAKLSAAVSSPRIQALAKARGFVPADPTTIGYVDLTSRRGR
jgi:cytoskeletal protein RodZ